MGGECCGGESLPAAQHALNDLHLNTLENNGAAQAAPLQSHEQSAKELEGFIRKRIELFEQYKAREDAVVRSLLCVVQDVPESWIFPCLRIAMILGDFHILY